MRSARSALERAQRRWAEAHGVAHDSLGYVRELDANLAVPLDARVQHELERGSELAPGRARPGRMWSLWSSAALVVNFFCAWRDRESLPLAAALGIAATPMRLALEEPLPTGLEGDPPTTDIALFGSGGGLLAAIESKFGEWLVRRPRNKTVLKDKYFPPGPGAWQEVALPECERLARDLQTGRERFKHLHAAQLLKHALGLARGGHRDAALVYLYYDFPGRESELHRVELERVALRIGAEVDFRIVTYQALFERVAPYLEETHRAYLAARYFRTAARV